MFDLCHFALLKWGCANSVVGLELADSNKTLELCFVLLDEFRDPIVSEKDDYFLNDFYTQTKQAMLARLIVSELSFASFCGMPTLWDLFREQMRYIRKNIRIISESWTAGCPWNTQPGPAKQRPFSVGFLSR